MGYYFLDSIISKLESFSDPSKENDLRDFLKNKFIWELQKALLSGEYYGDAEERLMKIDKLLDTIGAQKTLFVGGKSLVFNTRKSGGTLLKEKYVQIYLDLIRNLERGLVCLDKGEESKVIDIKIFEGHAIFRDVSDIMEIGNKKFDIENFNTFLIGVLLVYIDEYLECTEEELRVLERVRHFLKKTSMNAFSHDVVTLYMHKTDFLIYKIECRYSHQTNDGERGERNLPSISKDNFYYPFVEKIINHYHQFSCQNPEQLYGQVCKMLDGEKGSFTIGLLHQFNKYYAKISLRDLPFRKDKIDKVLEKLKQKQENLIEDSLFDRIAYKSIFNLLSNSSIRLHQRIEESNQYPNIVPHIQLYLREETTEVLPGFLKEMVKKSSTDADGNEFSDYFCYVNLLKFLNGLNNHLLENVAKLILDKEPAISTEKLRARFSTFVGELKKVYEQAIYDLKDNLRKTRSYESKPVYLAMNECMIKYTWRLEMGVTVDGNLFLDSAYILPNNFEKVQKKAETWEAFITPQLNLLKEAFDVVLGSHSVKSSITNFEGKMKENDFKVVQVVALFVSIATFVLINVKIFDGKSGLESFGIILGLASCFFLFNLFLYFIFLAQFRGGTSAKGFALKILLWIVTPLLLAGGSFAVLNNEKFKSSAELKSMKERLYKDSVQIEYLKEKIK